MVRGKPRRLFRPHWSHEPIGEGRACESLTSQAIPGTRVTRPSEIGCTSWTSKGGSEDSLALLPDPLLPFGADTGLAGDFFEQHRQDQNGIVRGPGEGCGVLRGLPDQPRRSDRKSLALGLLDEPFLQRLEAEPLSRQSFRFLNWSHSERHAGRGPGRKPSIGSRIHSA